MLLSRNESARPSSTTPALRRLNTSAATAHALALGALATDATRQLDVLWHDRDALAVDRAEVGVLEEADEVRLRRLLEGEHSLRLEAEVGLELGGDLTDEALERELADEHLRRLLVATDL